MTWNVSENWVEYTRRILESDSDITSKDLYDAFVRIAYLYAVDYLNLKVLENYIAEKHGADEIEKSVLESKCINDIAFNEINYAANLEHMEANLLDILNAIQCGDC